MERQGEGGIGHVGLKDHKLIKVIMEFKPVKIVYESLGVGKSGFPPVSSI